MSAKTKEFSLDGYESGSKPLQSESSFSGWRVLATVGVIIAAGLLAYSNSLGGPFILDDITSIPENHTIRRLWPIWQVLSPPTEGQAIHGRPIANLSLAINYWLGELEVTGYHIFNLSVHILAALSLFGVVRRTLRLPIIPERFSGSSTGLALVIALIWTVHPLQTNAVTYIIQRTELLAGLFYLLTLYCVIRGNSSPRSVFWYVTAVITCALGMGSKEVMISAPLVIFIHDRLFLSGSFKGVLRRRWPLYVGLAATCGLTVAFHVVAPYVSQRAPFGPLDYAPRQFAAISKYLRLCVWPAPLILDYGSGETPSFWQALPYAIFIIIVLAGTLVAVRCKPWISFLGIWFFCILAPSTSFVALGEWAAEKRMYLPLAAVVVAVVLCGYITGIALLARLAISDRRRARLGRALGYILAGAVVVVLGLLTVQRNYDYASEFSIWDATVRDCPDNLRAYNNRGLAYLSRGDYERAIQDFYQTIKLDSSSSRAYNNRAVAYKGMGQLDRAIGDYNEAIKLNPSHADSYYNRGITYQSKGEYERAVQDFDQAIKLNPGYAHAHNNRGQAYLSKGEYERAIQDFDQATKLDPGYAQAYVNRGIAHGSKGKYERAIEDFDQAIKSNPGYARAYSNRGSAYAGKGEYEHAIRDFEKAIQLAQASGDKKLAKRIRRRLELYKAKRPYP